VEPPQHPLPVPARRRSRGKRYAILIAGWFFVVLGILGMFLPILQGFLFLAIGLYMLSLESPMVKRLMDRFAARHPKFAAKIEDMREQAMRWVHRIAGKR
jgi:uncharacterized membrane protein YbaN (DUF454 family)